MKSFIVISCTMQQWYQRAGLSSSEVHRWARLSVSCYCHRLDSPCQEATPSCASPFNALALAATACSVARLEDEDSAMMLNQWSECNNQKTDGGGGGDHCRRHRSQPHLLIILCCLSSFLQIVIYFNAQTFLFVGLSFIKKMKKVRRQRHYLKLWVLLLRCLAKTWNNTQQPIRRIRYTPKSQQTTNTGSMFHFYVLTMGDHTTCGQGKVERSLTLDVISC